MNGPDMGGILLNPEWQLCSPITCCLMLFEHVIRAAASRTFWTAGKSRPMRIAMMAMTTNSSISVNARHLGERKRAMEDLRNKTMRRIGKEPQPLRLGGKVRSMPRRNEEVFL